MDVAVLDPFLTADDPDLEALVELLAGLDEKQRKALSGPARKAADGWHGRKHSAVALVLLGCGTGVRQVADGIQWLTISNAALPLAAQVLSDRKPSLARPAPRRTA